MASETNIPEVPKITRLPERQNSRTAPVSPADHSENDDEIGLSSPAVHRGRPERRLARASSILNEFSAGAVNLVEKQKASLLRKLFLRRTASQDAAGSSNKDNNNQGKPKR